MECYDMKVTEDQKGVQISLSSLARIAQDALIILTVCSMFFGPLWYFNVQKPIGDISSRMNKLEAAQEVSSERINQIDKNVAVILERTVRLDGSLNSIRNFLEKGK